MFKYRPFGLICLAGAKSVVLCDLSRWQTNMNQCMSIKEKRKLCVLTYQFTMKTIGDIHNCYR